MKCNHPKKPKPKPRPRTTKAMIQRRFEPNHAEVLIDLNRRLISLERRLKRIERFIGDDIEKAEGRDLRYIIKKAIEYHVCDSVLY